MLARKKKVFFQLPLFWKRIVDFNWSGQAYLVGGTVRNILLGRRAFDCDLLVSRLSEPEAFGLAAQLESPFFRLGKEKYVYRIITPEGRIDLIPFFSQSLLEEAQRRDFTINSLFLPLSALKKKEISKDES